MLGSCEASHLEGHYILFPDCSRISGVEVNNQAPQQTLTPVSPAGINNCPFALKIPSLIPRKLTKQTTGAPVVLDISSAPREELQAGYPGC